MAGDSKEMTCAHHLGGRGSPVLDQNCGGNLYAFAGSGTMTAPASFDTGLAEIAFLPPRPAPFIAWWTRQFRGGADQVLEVRHWLEDLLPDCAARADVILLASELCTNAIVHSRSGEAGGQFSVDIDWARLRPRQSPRDQATGPRWASPGAGCCLSTALRMTGGRPAAPTADGCGRTSSGKPGAARR